MKSSRSDVIKHLEFPREKVIFQEELGEGQFGAVLKALAIDLLGKGLT
jgi:hypothetical protein